MSPTEEIKNRLDIVDIVSESVQLRKSGRSYTGFCPFHSNTKTPAFVVFPESQTWRCFGACADGGDVFSFVMKKHGWDFKEALEQLARRAGVTLHEPTPAQKARQATEAHLTDLLEAAADYFHQLLLYAPQAEHARRYVEKRDLTQKTLADFRIGYALDAWDACRNHFLGQGYTEQDLIDAGLMTVNAERGTRYDRFRNRLMIPIRDLSGRVVGFGARTLDPGGIPKYLNSPQTELFDKSHLVYGLDVAKRHIREARQVVIAEGYMDVIQAWQAGFRNVVAQMGTSLTGAQLQLLKRYTKRFVIALDADAAGTKATLRSLEVARGALDREMEVRFDAPGLVKYEGRLKADIRIATLPEGEDPDSIIRHNRAAWPQLVAKAKPVVEYVIGVLTRDLDLNDPKNKTAVAQKVIPLIQDVVNPVEREHYWQTLARTLQVDDRALRRIRVPDKGRYSQTQPQRRAIGEGRKRGDGRKPVSPPPAAAPSASLSRRAIAVRKREANFLRECLDELALIRKVNQRLREHGQPAVGPNDFTTTEDQMLFRFLQRTHLYYPAAVFAVNGEMWDSLDVVLQQRVKKLLALPVAQDSEREKLPDILSRSVLDWRLENTHWRLSEVEQLWHDAERESNAELVEMYREQMVRLPLVIHRIEKARAAMTALQRRLAESPTRSRA